MQIKQNFFFHHLISIIFIFIILIQLIILVNASNEKEDASVSFWYYEVKKNPNLMIIDKSIYEFNYFAAKLSLQNQTILYEKLKVQLKHLINHLNDLCASSRSNPNDCMHSSCKGSNDVEYVKGCFYCFSMESNFKIKKLFFPFHRLVFFQRNEIQRITIHS